VRRAVVALVLASTALAGCGSDQPRPDGPVTLGSTPGVNCVLVTPSDSYTMGFDLIRNTGAGPVEITAVELAEASGLQLAEAFLVPVAEGGGTLVGVGMAWPPTGADLPEAWAQRVVAVGPDRLDPGTAGVDGWNLVLHLTAPTGTTTAGYTHVVLRYRQDSEDYVAVDAARFEVRTAC
jgi:hypothetical protein